MPKCQFLFSAVFGFRNPSNEIFSESDEIKTQVPILPGSIQNTREPPERGHRPTKPQAGAARGGPAPPYGVGTSSTLLRRLFAYIKPLHRKPLQRKPRYAKPSRAAAIAKPRSGGQESLFRHPAGRGSAPGRLLHRHRCHLHRHLHHRCCSHEEGVVLH